MEIIGSALFILMGCILGIIGAGGAILIIPILIYLFKFPATLSTAYSLFIVSITAFVGVLRYRKYISIGQALVFAIPSLCGVFLTRFYIFPRLPNTIFGLNINSIIVYLLIMVMFMAAYFMIKGAANIVQNSSNFSVKIIPIAFTIGSVMGFLGAGGGFLIIPTLVLLLGFEMRIATTTSLFIVMLNTLVGFLSDRLPLTSKDYLNLFYFTIISLIGMLIGTYINSKMAGEGLKKIFGWFIASVAMTMSIKEIFF